MLITRRHLSPCLFLITGIVIAGQLSADECADWTTAHPEWIWCDSFESDAPLSARYERVSINGLGRSTVDAIDGGASLQQTYTPGQVNASWIVKSKPSGFPNPVFYRWYHKFDHGYTHFPPKMARAGHRRQDTRRTAVFMVHSWIAGTHPTLDTRAENSGQTTTNWLPVAKSSFDLSEHLGQWISYEVEIKLNSPGNADGHYRLWIDNHLAIERTGVDLRGNTVDKINEIMLDTYWNAGAPSHLLRFYDGFVISTKKIGPLQTPAVTPLPSSKPQR